MTVLPLTLKKKWFDMILSGDKKEEYREIKQYWANRLMNHFYAIDGWKSQYVDMDKDSYHKLLSKDFDAIKFTNGYQKNAPWFLIECKGIDVGPAVPEWSDNWEGHVFRIKLGQLIAGNCLP